MRILLMRQECGACGGSTPVWSDVCTQCGLVLHSARRLRAAGVVYLVLGLFLSTAGTYVMLMLTGIIPDSDNPQSTIRFSSTWGAVLVFAFVSFVLLVGVIAILMGAWQVVYGRRNLKLVRVVIVLFIIFWVGGLLLQIFTLAEWFARRGGALPNIAMHPSANQRVSHREPWPYRGRVRGC